jgi:RND family efflux transporter MFP subunit
MKSSPAKVKQEERPLRVEAIQVAAEDVPVFITAHGEVRSLDIVTIAPEVSGKIREIHPGLEVGETVPKGSLLFRVDQRDCAANVEGERAAVKEWRNKLLRVEKQFKLESARLVTLQRNCDLAKAEFERVRKLFDEDKVGTRSKVESAEQGYNSACDQVDQMQHNLELNPIMIREAENNLAAALSRLTIAETRLKRCEVRAPFSGRVKQVSLEVGQYVAAGQNVLTLANDSVLEIHVPLDSQDARRWLRFDGEKSQGTAAWFSKVIPVPCAIRWTEDREGQVWYGQLHHVVKFDQQTRTLTVAVRIEAKDALSVGQMKLPLVEGMFCWVEIPGRIMNNVFRLPRWAVSFRNTVYVSVNNRLKTVPVKIERVEGEEVFVASGLNPGDLVVTTRLNDPLENALLDITNVETFKREASS